MVSLTFRVIPENWDSFPKANVAVDNIVLLEGVNQKSTTIAPMTHIDIYKNSNM